MNLRTLLPALVLTLAACTGSGDTQFVTQETGTLEFCWPQDEALAPGPRRVGIEEFRNRGRGTLMVEFGASVLLRAATGALAIPEGEVRSVQVDALQYFEGTEGLDYTVKDASGAVLESGNLYVENSCPPAPPPPPPPAVETYTCGFAPDLVGITGGGFGPYAGDVACVGTSQGACVLDLETGASDNMNGFLGRTYGCTAWSPVGKDVLLAYGPFGWWSRIYDSAAAAWGATTLSGGGEPNVTAIVPKGGDRFADTAYYVGYGNNWIGKFEIVGGVVQATGNVVRPDVLPAGEKFIHAYSDDGQTFLALTVEDGTGTNRLRIAQAGTSDPAVLVGTLGTGGSQLAVVNDVWAVRTDTLLVAGTWDGANAAIGASVDVGAGGVGVALLAVPGDTLIGVPLQTSIYVTRYSAPAAGTEYDLDPAFTEPAGVAWWMHGPDFLLAGKGSNNIAALSYDW